jgi:AcrR family transcriptional regulator
MGRPRQVTDEQIVEATRRIVLARGVQVSVNAIAADLDVSHTALFARFGTKEALLLAAFAPPPALPFLPHLRRGPDERDVREQLREIAALFVAYFERIGQGWAVLQAAGIGLDKVFVGRARPSPLAAYDVMRSWFARANERGLLACETDALAWTFLGALHQRVFQGSLPGSAAGRAAARDVAALVELLWHGAAPQPRTPPSRSKNQRKPLRPAQRPGEPKR